MNEVKVYNAVGRTVYDTIAAKTMKNTISYDVNLNIYNAVYSSVAAIIGNAIGIAVHDSIKETHGRY